MTTPTTLRQFAPSARVNASAVHTVAEIARYWSHPDVAALKAVVRVTDPKDRKAYKAALNAVRDRISALKASK